MKNGMTVPPKIKNRITMKKWSDVTQMCLTLCDPMDYSLSGSSVHGIFQTRIPEWVAISFSRRSSRSRDWTWVSCIIGRHFIVLAPYDPTILGIQLSLGVHRVSSRTICGFRKPWVLESLCIYNLFLWSQPAADGVKNLHINGQAQFKPMLFKSHLYTPKNWKGGLEKISVHPCL